MGLLPPQWQSAGASTSKLIRADEKPAEKLTIEQEELRGISRTVAKIEWLLLNLLAKCVNTELRHTDVLGRYGGDELVVLLPDTPDAGALDVAKRIRATVAGTSLEVEGTRITSTVSIGIASFPEDGRSIDGILARVDRAMYQAKKQDRNKVIRRKD